MSETDFPHTKLGTRHGYKGPYPQSREYDENGWPVRDIDFTDHGEPLICPCPHQHRWIKDSKGLLKKHAPEPVPEWDYELERC